MKISLSIFLLFLAFAKLQAQGFVKVTDANNPIANFTITPIQYYVGAAWVDIDNDGDIDLFAAPNKLFENLGAGNFQSKATTIGSGIINPDWAFAGTTWADVDNDGDIDCFLAGNLSKLYFNNGTGSFSAATTTPPNSLAQGWAGAFGDYNADTYADIAVTQPSISDVHGLVLASTGSQAWQSITGLAFTDSNGPYTIPTWADYDDDGDFDLFVASGPAIEPPAAPDFIYKNQLKETGTPTLAPLTGFPFDTPQDGQSYSFIDYDNDGHLDICLTNYDFAPNRLYHNNGDGTWTGVSTPFTSTSIKYCLSNAWGDFDNDGDLDVIFTRDNQLKAMLYFNNGQGSFTLNTSSPVSQHTNSTGASIGDYDNDGDLDVFIHGQTDVQSSGKALFRNELTNNNHWVSFKLTGTESNKSAIGAKVRIRANIGGETKWLRRDVSAQNTFQGQNDLRVHFGLGAATVIDSMVVWFPSGNVTTCGNVEVDKFYTVEEIDGVWSACTTPTLEAIENGQFNIMPNPAFDEITLSLENGETFGDAVLSIFDITGKRHLELPFSSKIDISELAVGAYFILVKNGKKVWSGKFFKP